MRRPFALLLPLALVVACADATTPADTALDTTPDLAAASLGALADGARLNGDSAAAVTYAEAQRAVTMAGQSGAMTIAQDGVAESWRAVAYRTQVPAWCPQIMAPTTPLVCRLSGGPSIVAWSAVRPERLLMLSAPEGSSQVPGITGPTPPTAATLLRGQYLDRSVTGPIPTGPQLPGLTPPPSPGPMALPWMTTAGTATQQTTTDGTPCVSGGTLPPGTFGRCVLGRSTVAFDVTVSLWGSAGATRTRRLAATSTTVPAVVLQLDSLVVPAPVPPPPGAPRPPTPPVPPAPMPPPGLVSRLEVLAQTRDSVVLRFTVRNAGATPLVLAYANGQRDDFEAMAAGTRTVAWRWSTGVGFVQAAGVDTMAAGTQRQATVTWRSPARGAYVVRGFTVNSAGPRSESVAPVVVP